MFDFWLLFMLFRILFLKPFPPTSVVYFSGRGNGEHFFSRHIKAQTGFNNWDSKD